MAEHGIIVTQEGVPVERAADYQKVLDSRWRFMEREHLVDLTISVPALSTVSNRTVQRVKIFEHELDFVPAFHGSWKPSLANSLPNFDINFQSAGIYCKDDQLYFRRIANSGQALAATDVTVKAIIYNLPILEPYEAPSEPASGAGRAESNIGLRALDGSDPNINIGSNSAHGFSVDTKKKILSVHKTDYKYINSWMNDKGTVTAVNTTTDTFTFGPSSSGSDLDWMETGIPITMVPDDFVTYPAPLSNSTYYLIMTSSTTFKLALSKANAEAGTAIDITSTGSLPIEITRGFVKGDDSFEHRMGYPPSFFFCEALDETDIGISVAPLRHISTTPLVTVDTNYLYLNGVQSVYSARVAMIILKDPVEIAQ